MYVTELMTETADILRASDAFASVIIRDDKTAVIGREPAAYLDYAGMASINDNGVMTEEHTVNVYVRLLSIGSANLTPLNTAIKTLAESQTQSMASSLDSTDSRTVTFKITAKYRMVPS